MCDQVAWLDHGSLVSTGGAAPTIAAYYKSLDSK
jgi:ABC-type polysaccharide/polyol phosphate transport system ATPase subunit